MRCAVYARYSSDQQRVASIEDQVRVCRSLAEPRGWHIAEGCIFRDDEVSGSGMDRPGLLRLMERATAADCPFDIILVDDTSRLSRDVADAHRIFAQFRYYGRRAIAVSQGIDTESPQAEVLLSVHGIMDSMYVKELAAKTHRGQEGRVLQGLHAGGRCFGYRTEACGDEEDSGKRMVIEPGEAEVVQRIFEMSAAGGSLFGIAKQLNAERIPPPQSRAGRERPSWCPTAIRAMLFNERYRGRVVWNRSRYIKRPGTNKRVARPRPRSEWRVIEAPDLRIVSEELWGQVQTGLEEKKRIYTRGEKRAGLLNRAASSPYLLTGLLKCGECGANLTIVGGYRTRGTARYGCPQNHKRGTCGNSTKQRVEDVERYLLGALQRTILHPEVLEFAFQEFVRQLTPAPAKSDDSGRRAELTKEIANLASAIATAGHSDVLLRALADRESELQAMNTRRAATAGISDPATLRKFFDGKMVDLVGLLNEPDVPAARAELREMVPMVRMIPNGDHYIAEGEASLPGSKLWLVAGARFELATFGL